MSFAGVEDRNAIQAEILNIKLKRLNEYNSNRKIMANNYNLAFAKVSQIVTPRCIDASEHVYHQYTIKIKNNLRDKLKSYLSEKGIPSMIYYPIPIHRQKPYLSNQYLPNTDLLSEEVISLPIHSEIENSNQDYIIDTVNNFFTQF